MMLVTAVALLASLPTVQDGDLIFHTSRSRQSLAVQRATRSRYSHMGVILTRAGKPHVFEAVSRVRYTPLSDWIARGEGGRFVIKRLKDAPTRLSRERLEGLRRAAGTYAGRPYDLTFAWSDDRIYCSELVWKMYRDALGIEIGSLQKLREFDLDDPAVRTKLKERYGKKVPFDEPAISPQAMFDSSLVETVVEH